MSKAKKSKKTKNVSYGVISTNRKARFNYDILETIEAGISLLGSEVKSIRKGNVSLQEGYIEINNGNAFLVNTNIGEYSFTHGFVSHNPIRNRQLLLHKKQINKIAEKVKLKGMTIVPLKIYCNSKNLIKLEIGLAKGKAMHDKRQVIKEREAKREADIALKNYRSSKL